MSRRLPFSSRDERLASKVARARRSIALAAVFLGAIAAQGACSSKGGPSTTETGAGGGGMCLPLGASCDAQTASCCSDTQCAVADSAAGTNTCCRPFGGACTKWQDCCNDPNAPFGNQDADCNAGKCCLGGGRTPAQPSDCCGSVGASGNCCAPYGVSCLENADCCESGYWCGADYTCCVGPGLVPKQGEACCADFGTTSSGACCVQSGSTVPCTTDTDCCSGTCTAGTCG